VLSEKFRAIGADRLRRCARGYERDLPGEVAGPGIPRQNRTALAIALADDLQRSVLARRSQHPFGVVRGSQTPGPIIVIPHRQADQFDWIVWRNDNQKVLLEIATDMGEARVALAVADRHGCSRSERQRCWRPEVTGLLVAQIDRFAGRIRSRIVGPRTEAIRLAVARPAVAKTCLRHQTSEPRIGEHIRPGSRRQHGSGL
jgi:hypothetical protein